MTKEASNNYLAIIAVLVIALSMFSILSSLEKLGITGASNVGVGYTNVTVPATTDITVVNAQINFTDSAPGVTKDSHAFADIASGCSVDATCGINITNDGSVNVNISMANTEDLFDTGSTDVNYLYNLTFGNNATGQRIDCSTGGSSPGALAFTGDSGWRAMPGVGTSEVAICDLNFSDSSDSVMIDINITVPPGEGAGIKSGTITFTASQGI
jgi:hypothetical protein